MKTEFNHITDGVLKTKEHTYHLAESLTVDKYQEFLILQNQVAFGIDFETMFTRHKEIYEALNKMDFVKASAIAYNTMEGIKSGYQSKKNPVLELCALFLIREDEDQTVFDKRINDEKIADWMQSGIDYKDFFQFAASVVPGLLTALDEISEITLVAEKKLKALKQTGKEKSKSDDNGS